MTACWHGIPRHAPCHSKILIFFERMNVDFSSFDVPKFFSLFFKLFFYIFFLPIIYIHTYMFSNVLIFFEKDEFIFFLFIYQNLLVIFSDHFLISCFEKNKKKIRIWIEKRCRDNELNLTLTINYVYIYSRMFWYFSKKDEFIFFSLLYTKISRSFSSIVFSFCLFRRENKLKIRMWLTWRKDVGIPVWIWR